MSKVVLITGVSSGFGREISSRLALKEFIVYGTCRSECEPIPGVILQKMDVTDNASITQTVQQIIQKEGKIDVLINNAGMGFGGALESYTDEEMHLQMGTNYSGTFQTCRAVLPYMRNQGYGTIINFSSIGGLMGLPFQGGYSASKYAIEGFSESLRYEVKSFGINVIVINPGDFNTQFTAKRKSTTGSSLPAYTDQFQKTLTIIEKDEHNGMNPVFMAVKIEHILQKKHPKTRYLVASFEQKLAVWLKHILPDKLFYSIIGGHYGVK
jgi:NAD(P)-dependent dehydrogenase (short-subunit alcohol dehydrogenase family)